MNSIDDVWLEIFVRAIVGQAQTTTNPERAAEDAEKLADAGYAVVHRRSPFLPATGKQ